MKVPTQSPSFCFARRRTARTLRTAGMKLTCQHISEVKEYHNQTGGCGVVLGKWRGRGGGFDQMSFYLFKKKKKKNAPRRLCL